MSAAHRFDGREIPWDHNGSRRSWSLLLDTRSRGSTLQTAPLRKRLLHCRQLDLSIAASRDDDESDASREMEGLSISEPVTTRRVCSMPASTKRIHRGDPADVDLDTRG